MGNTDGNMRNSMDGGGMSGHNSVGRVSLNCGVVDMRGLNDLLDGVNLVGSWDWDSTWDSNLIRLGDMETWTISRGTARGIATGTSTLYFWTLICGTMLVYWGDGSIRRWGSRDDWSGKGNGVNKVLGRSGNIRMGSLGDGFLSSNSISMPSNNLLDSNLDGSLSNQSVFNTVLNYWGSSSIRSVSLSNHCGSGC